MDKLFLDKKAIIGIVGLGYVGLPLAIAACQQKISVIGFDIDPEKIATLNSGKSYFKHIPNEKIGSAVSAGLFRATTDFAEIAKVDGIIICVPTPLTVNREPDLSYVEKTVETIAPYIRRGQLLVLESTSWPGTTEEVVKPILERHGLKSGEDFYLAFSPEREDPGNRTFSTHIIPKVVGANDPVALKLATAMYQSIVEATVPVSSTKTAEAVKLTENIFRAVNIALVNELKIIFEKMGIDIWEVIKAAKTKPFGYMPFYPGPGLGGHCIPIDPFYLSWKAREFEVSARFIELAGEINIGMPYYVVDRLALALDQHSGRGLLGANILIIGASYKKNIEDTRGSPAFKLIEILEKRGAATDFYDPYVEQIQPNREYPHLTGRTTIKWDLGVIRAYDAVIIVTDHDAVDYRGLCENAKLIIDTRDACAGIAADNVVKA